MGEDVADDLCTALALKLIASDTMPLTIKGKILSTELVRACAAEGKPLMVWALLSDNFRERVAAWDAAGAQALQQMQREMFAVRDLVKSWNANEETQFKLGLDDSLPLRRSHGSPTHRRYGSRRVSLDLEQGAQRRVRERGVLGAGNRCVGVGPANPAKLGFRHKVEMERREAGAVDSRAAALSSAYGWAVVRKYHAFNGVLFHPWWVLVIAVFITGGMFALFSAIALPVLAFALRKTLNRFLVNQDGAGAFFYGRNLPSAFSGKIVDSLGKDLPLKAIERELDDCNDRLKAYAAKGIQVVARSKGSPKYGCLTVFAMLICIVAPFPLTMVMSGVMALVHRL